MVADDDGPRGPYDDLTRVAPTIVVARGFPEWRPATLALAEAVGDVEDARQQLSKIDQRIDEVGDRVAAAGSPVLSMVRLRGDTAYSYTGGWSAAIVEAVSFERPAGFGYDPESAGVEVSAERIADLDGDVLLVATDPESDASATYRNNPLWSRLDAVRADSVLEIDSGSWTIESLANAGTVLDDLERAPGSLDT